MRQPLLVVTVDDEGEEVLSEELHEVVYKPKIPTIGVLGVSYLGFGASYSHNLDGEDEDELAYTDYRLSLLYTQVGFEAAYTEFERFQVAESSGFDDKLGKTDTKRVTMASTFTTASLFYFPLRLGYDLGSSLEPARMKETGVGLGVVGSYTESTIRSPEGMIPEPWQRAFGPDGSFEAGKLSCTSLQAALGGTLTAGPFFVTGLYALGGGRQAFSYRTETHTRSGIGVADKESMRIGLGYSANRTFLALQYAQESPRYVLRNMSISAESSDLSAQFGVKF